MDLSLYGLHGDAEHDQISDRFYYRIGNKGYIYPDWSRMMLEERENIVAYLAKLEEQQKKLQSIPPMEFGAKELSYGLGDMLGVQPYTVNDTRSNTYEKLPEQTSPLRTSKAIRDMSMAEYAQLRKNYGIGTNTGSGGLFAPEPVKTKTKFDKWLDAREAFINGTGTLEDLLKYVESGEDGYSRIVDEEIAKERASNVAVSKHRINWRRWPLWRWMVAWLHWGDLGWRRNR